MVIDAKEVYNRAVPLPAGRKRGKVRCDMSHTLDTEEMPRWARKNKLTTPYGMDICMYWITYTRYIHMREGRI